jgi:hypothetical protein
MTAFKFTLCASLFALTLAPVAASAATMAAGDMPQAATPGLHAPVALKLFIPRSAAPEPATWAMMLAGFAGAGAVLRRRGGRYRLVEALPGGAERSEEFVAPDDATALRRAAAVAEGHMELWRGKVRIAPQLHG